MRLFGQGASVSSDQSEQPYEGEYLGAVPLTAGELESLVDLIRAGDREKLSLTLSEMHESDVAEIIGLLTSEQRLGFMGLIGRDLPSAVFAELDDHIRLEIVEFVDSLKLAATLEELDSDDAVFVLEDLSERQRDEVLELVPQSTRLVLERSLDFPDDSAGRLMQSTFVAVPPFWTVGQTIDYMRETEDLPSDFFEVYVTNEIFEPIGSVHLSQVLRAQRPVVIETLVSDDFTQIPADTDREEVARLFERYNLVSAAVIDKSQRMIGVITPDDVFEVIVEEAGEDILLLGGVGDEAVTDTMFEAARGRFGWLFLNLLTAIAASIVIGLFDASIEKMVALAVLMPIVASMGGNAGTQTLTITVRGLATQELQAVNMMRVVYREFGVGILNGIVFAVVTGLVAAIWFESTALGSVLAGAMIVNLVVAALAGILIPIGLDRVGVDPAVASTVFVTTVTDVIGFLAFLSFATIFLL